MNVLDEIGGHPARNAIEPGHDVLVLYVDPRAEQFLGTAGVRVVRTPAFAPNCNAYAERFIRSVKGECLNRVMPLGERHLRGMLRQFAVHYQHERNHQGLANELIDSPGVRPTAGAVRRSERIGGILSYYYRAAA